MLLGWGWALVALGGHAHVDWTAPAACGGTSVLEAAAEGAAADGADVRLDGTVRESPVGYELDLRIVVDGVERERSLSDADCSALAEAAQLLLAIAVAEREPPGEVPPPADAPEPAATAKTPPEAEHPRSEPEPEPEPGRDRGRVGVSMGAWGGAAVGELAGWSGVVGGGPALRGRRFVAAFELQAALPDRLALRRGAVRMWAWAARLRGGPSFALHRLVALDATLGVEAGQVRAWSRGIRSPAADQLPRLAGLAALQLGVQLPRRVSLGLRPEVAVHALRSRFAVGGQGIVYRTPRVTGRAVFEIRVAFQ